MAWRNRRCPNGRVAATWGRDEYSVYVRANRLWLSRLWGKIYHRDDRRCEWRSAPQIQLLEVCDAPFPVGEGLVSLKYILSDSDYDRS